MVRFTAFIIALLLAVGAINPTGPWLVTLAVLTGVAVLVGGRPRLRRLRAWAASPWDGGDW